MLVKLDTLRIERKLRDLDSLNPMTMRIEDIAKIPEDIPLTRSDETDVGTKELMVAEGREKIASEIKSLLSDKMRDSEVDHLLT